METEFGGAPVDGGTFPALIFARRRRRLRLDHGRAQTTARTSRRLRRGRPVTGRRPTPDASTRHRPRPPRRRPTRPRRAAPEHRDRARLGAAAARRRRRRPAAAAPPAPPAAGSAGGVSPRLAALAARRGGSGRERYALPAAQKRHGQLGRLGDPDPRPGRDRRPRATRPRAAQSSNGGRSSGAPLSSRPIPSATVSLPGPEQSSRALVAPAPAAHLRRARGVGSSARIRTAAARPVGLADGVEQAVDPVGEVDVGEAGRTEQRRCALA